MGHFYQFPFWSQMLGKFAIVILLSETAVTPCREIRCSLVKRSVLYAASTKTNDWTKSSSISS
jgi:hypothetical protein